MGILIAARAFRKFAHFVAVWLGRFVPQRAATLAGFAISLFIAWSIGNGILIRNVVRVLDNSYREVDQFIPPDAPPPAAPLKTGGPDSLIAWESIGRCRPESHLVFPVTGGDCGIDRQASFGATSRLCGRQFG
ncbi:MAG: hypothetical protein IPH79_14535 [Sphingomonadales bacterium]|nr:hypothetical protein [Sphingomonadales bacterium]